MKYSCPVPGMRYKLDVCGCMIQIQIKSKVTTEFATSFLQYALHTIQYIYCIYSIGYKIGPSDLQLLYYAVCTLYRQYGRSFLVSVLRDLLTSLIFGERPEQFAVKL